MSAKFAAANLRAGFYKDGPDIYFVTASTSSFQLRGRGAAMLLPVPQLPVSARFDEGCEEESVLCLLSEAAEGIGLAQAVPGIYRAGKDYLVCVSEQIFWLRDGRASTSLPAGALLVSREEELKQVESKFATMLGEIRRKLVLGLVFLTGGNSAP